MLLDLKCLFNVTWTRTMMALLETFWSYLISILNVEATAEYSFSGCFQPLESVNSIIRILRPPDSYSYDAVDASFFSPGSSFSRSRVDSLTSAKAYMSVRV